MAELLKNICVSVPALILAKQNTLKCLRVCLVGLDPKTNQNK